MKDKNPLSFFIFLLLMTWMQFAYADLGKKKVITTFTILHDMAKNVAGDKLDLACLTKYGAEIHGYEPTPQDLVKVQRADLILWNGLNLELWFEKFFSKVKGVKRVMLTEGIQPLSILEGPYLGKPNPHAWMSPDLALIYVANIKKGLVELDPKNAFSYEENAKKYSAKILNIKMAIDKKLKKFKGKKMWLVTSEGAFSYLTKSLGFQELFLWPINADQMGTPRQVQKVIDQMRLQKVKVIFSESTISDQSAKQVAKEIGGYYGGVLYVDSLTDESGPVPTYLQLLEKNMETILSGLEKE